MSSWARFVASITWVLLAARASEEHPWEWSGIFDFQEAGHYTWTMARRDGSYADASMKLTFHSASGTDIAALEALEATVDNMWDTTSAWTQVEQGGSDLVAGAPYNLVFDQDTWFTNYKIYIALPGPYAIFTEHVPLEFESDFHFLKEDHGHDVEPTVEEGGDGHDHGGDHDGHDHGGDHDGHDHGGDGGGHDHGHGDGEAEGECPWTHPWEWAGVVDLPAGHYTWTFARSGEDYADASMKMYIMDAGALPGSSETLHSASEGAAHEWEDATTWQSRQSGQTLAVGTPYTLNFDQESWMTYFMIDHPGGTLAFFCQHIPLEFETSFHFFRNELGEDVEFDAEEDVTACSESVAEDTDGRWGEVILGSFLTCLPTLLGILGLAYAMPKVNDMVMKLGAGVESFASGAIMAASVFLLVPEALHLVNEEYFVGVGLLVGWASGLVSHHAFGHTQESLAGSAQSTNVPPANVVGQDTAGDADPKADAEANQKPQQPEKEDAMQPLMMKDRWAVALPVLYGDAMHNLSDGLVIGAAFRNCTTGFAWELIAVTIAHELPQELADVFILIRDCGFSWPVATLMNFASGMPCVLGAIATYAASGSDNTQGIILAFGAGVYFFVAMTELSSPMVHLKKRTVIDSLKVWLPFMIGAIAIGLVLLNHEHCDAPSDESTEEGEDPHAGHNH